MAYGYCRAETYSGSFVTFKYFCSVLLGVMKLYRTGKAAKMLGVHKVTVIGWIKEGKIRAIRIGKEFRVLGG